MVLRDIAPTVVRVWHSELNTVINFVVGNSQITPTYAVRNPHKLRWLEDEIALAR